VAWCVVDLAVIVTHDLAVALTRRWLMVMRRSHVVEPG
jgi:ABC-type phosphonate transport system ATPase subunit